MEIIKLKEDQGYGGNVKRFYAPFIIKWVCSKCGIPNEDHITDNYLSYPPYFKPFEHTLCCIDWGGCGNEERITLQLDFTLSTKQRKGGE